tara:strand:- start:5564 stop:6355 length:792 start_codon:yes stop_codon:yes gene_type:complete
LGEVSSSFKGFGMNFSEVREYQFGDETRFIDWNVTARYNRAHVKVFEEEKEQVNILMIDVSKSMDFGSKKKSKRELLVELYATIAFSCALNKDKVGVLFFSDKVERYFEPKLGMKNIWMIAKHLIEWQNESAHSDLQEPLRFLRSLKLKRFRLFLLSDFHFEKNKLQKEALVRTKKNNRAYALNVRDQMESNIPLKGFYQIVHSETGKRSWYNGFSRKKRNALQALEYQERQYWNNECRKNNIYYMEFSGEVDVFKKLNGLIQ